MRRTCWQFHASIPARYRHDTRSGWPPAAWPLFRRLSRQLTMATTCFTTEIAALLLLTTITVRHRFTSSIEAYHAFTSLASASSSLLLATRLSFLARCYQLTILLHFFIILFGLLSGVTTTFTVMIVVRLRLICLIFITYYFICFSELISGFFTFIAIFLDTTFSLH